MNKIHGFFSEHKNARENVCVLKTLDTAYMWPHTRKRTLTFNPNPNLNGRKRRLAISHRNSAISNLLVNVRRFHQTIRRFQQTVSSMEKALVVTL